jgi:hypothetical protein
VIPVVEVLHAPDPTIDIAVCQPISNGGTIIAGSEMENCAACTKPIWVHPTTRFAAPNARLLCVPCAVEAVKP